MKINIKVKPGSAEQSIVKIDENNYKVNLKSAPEKGKANLELLKLLKKEFGKQAKIIKGFSSRNKVVEI